MEIRRANERDVQAVTDLLKEVNAVHHNARPDLFKKATKYSKEELLAIFDEDRTPVFVCTDDKGEVLGHAFCIMEQFVNDRLRTDIKTLYIDDICVGEAHRRQGVGEALYAHVKAYAKTQGCYNLTLNVWSLNAAAKAFYERMGMQIQKTGMECLLS